MSTDNLEDLRKQFEAARDAGEWDRAAELSQRIVDEELAHKFLWGGVEYTDPPHQLEVDTGRGVLYLHAFVAGQTVLRVCRIPDDLIGPFVQGTGTVSINLKHTPAREGRAAYERVVKKEPVFLSLPQQPKEEGNSFSIDDIAGTVLFDFEDVPGKVIEDLRFGRFADITIGYTGRL